jgi:hypothetical protein
MPRCLQIYGMSKKFLLCDSCRRVIRHLALRSGTLTYVPYVLPAVFKPEKYKNVLLEPLVYGMRHCTSRPLGREILCI